MPIEGIETPTPPATTTPDAAANNTAASDAGAGTDTAQTTQAQTEKTFTQADVDRIVANRIKSGVKAELKRLTGETDGAPTVEDLTRQLSEAKTKAQAIEAREHVRDYLSDPENKLNIKPDNIRAIEKLVMPDIELDDNGKPTNLKEALKTAKSIAPALFANTPADINAARRDSAPVNDMNAFIRRQAGVG